MKNNLKYIVTPYLGLFCINIPHGSSTNEKLKVLEEYEPKHLKTLIIQDGTNNVLKHYNKNAQDNFAEHASLVAKCIEKFSPEVVVICEVPPLKQNAANTAKNAKIDAFNKLIHDNYADKYKILSLNHAVKDEGNRAFSQGNELGYNHLYFDNVHFNTRFGVPLLKNLLLAHLLLTSNGRVAGDIPSSLNVPANSNKAFGNVSANPFKANRVQFGKNNRFNADFNHSERRGVARSNFNPNRGNYSNNFNNRGAFHSMNNYNQSHGYFNMFD